MDQGHQWTVSFRERGILSVIILSGEQFTKTGIEQDLVQVLHTKSQRLGRKGVMRNKAHNLSVWPEDPAWPDPSGNDPYDVSA